MSLAHLSKEHNTQLLKQLEDECNDFEVNNEEVHANMVNITNQLENVILYNKNRSKICNTINYTDQNELEVEEKQDEVKYSDFLHPGRPKRKVFHTMMPQKLKLGNKSPSVEMLAELQMKMIQSKRIDAFIGQKIALAKLDSDLSFKDCCV